MSNLSEFLQSNKNTGVYPYYLKFNGGGNMELMITGLALLIDGGIIGG